MLIHNFLENSADKYPDKPAVWYRSEWKSYVQINCLANQVSNFLVDKGIQRGDRVALLFENSFEYIISYYAILKAGGVAVALNTDQVPNDLLYLLNHSGARALIIQNKFIPILKKLSNQTATLETILTDRVNEDDDRDERVSFYEFEKVYSTYSETKPSIRLINIDLAAIIYTSGSTGRPKGVTLTHLNIVTNTNSIIEYLDLSETDRIMVILPFPYVYGKSLLNTHFAAGGSVVIDNRFVFPNAILETMLTTDCTGFAGVPSTFSILLNKSSVKKYKFPRLRYLTQAGGPMAPAVQKEVASTLSPAKLFIMYGATEASARLSYLDPLVLSRKWGSIGKPIPNVDLYVADEKGNPVTPGETGEIVARGANIMVGYWNDQEETERVLRYGLYFTGDLGVM
ncbi:MAG: AMP-binding protein, partial [Aliifodinibius sp.]|nr:AMP-binding protein [Fodinibius sp.]NIV16592.1 AMP-binding protein [Fodinibius sp.]NIY30574.1 AMP-binding protein [Fodinibius sp.]